MVLGVDDLEFNRDRPLVERVQLGDEGAFEELYRLHYERLYRYCLYRLGESHEAQDVVQEAFARAWMHAPRIQGDLRFYPWLRTIAGNLCTDVGRRRARVQPAPSPDPGAVEGGQERIVESVDIALLEQAMSRLPERHRRVLELRESDGLSYEQLAERTGTSVGTVESLLWRARQGLKRQFAVVSGESILAGLPIIGWAIRRAHVLHAKVAARLAASNPNYINALGGAVGSVAIGSVVAVALVVGGASGSSGNSPGSALTTAAPASLGTAQAMVQLASQPLEPSQPVISARSEPASVASATTTTAPSRSRRTELTDPVDTNPVAARQEAQHDPVRLTVGAVTAGVNPQEVVQYVGGLLPLNPAIP